MEVTDGLRPVEWDDYIGQATMKERLSIHINSALLRDAALDHILLTGPPGCGKTTMAQIIANSYGVEFTSFIMPIKEKVLVAYLRLTEQGVILLDEIHRLSTKQQESYLSLLEDGYLQLDNGDRVESGDITIIGATTEPEKVIAPLYDRFAIKPPFDEYSDEEMQSIVLRMAEAVETEMTDEAAHVLGRASGGIPRNAKSLVFMARDLATMGYGLDVAEVLQKCRVDEDGFSEDHRRYCQVLAETGGISGLEILSAHLRLPKPTLIELERLLLKREVLQYTKSGRELIGRGWSVAKAME